jgi:hypothetical protein
MALSPKEIIAYCSLCSISNMFPTRNAGAGRTGFQLEAVSLDQAGEGEDETETSSRAKIWLQRRQRRKSEVDGQNPWVCMYAKCVPRRISMSDEDILLSGVGGNRELPGVKLRL